MSLTDDMILLKDYIVIYCGETPDEIVDKIEYCLTYEDCMAFVQELDHNPQFALFEYYIAKKILYVDEYAPKAA